MPQRSAGILLYRFREGRLEVLLAHPGGPYFAGRDDGVWTVPKGLIEADEDPLAAARREFEEEMGSSLPEGPFLALSPVRQKGGKIVLAWATEGDLDTDTIQSNSFRMEYPYKSGKWHSFPEVDGAGWFAIPEAREKILPAQAPFLSELRQLLGHDK